MPFIFDNDPNKPDQVLRAALLQSLQHPQTTRADFCVGYFNLRGWGSLAPAIEGWSGQATNCCRILVGMHVTPEAEFRQTMQMIPTTKRPDFEGAKKQARQMALSFREQLTIGIPTAQDEQTLRQLAQQLQSGKVRVKLYTRQRLHAKLYLCHQADRRVPIVGFLGSSNLTLSGLSVQGELNIDVVEADATAKLASWFDEHWDDALSIDITDELIKAIDESWARETPIPPHHIYIKMAYHLSREAQTGLSEFSIPAIFGERLFDYQSAAVRIAARHLDRRGGVLIGDVVGLGKTLMAAALVKIFDEDFNYDALILCPRNLVRMWDEEYVETYGLRAHVMAMSEVLRDLPELRRYRLVVIDESHNLRNREGKTYRAIKDYIEKNECKCILLSATPYNKTYLDLSNQLRLFIPEARPLSIRPERLLREMGEDAFRAKHQAEPRTLAAFEKSEYPDDWRELMRLFMVRRTRSFIQQHYAHYDEARQRYYLTFEDGTRSYFPVRQPQTLRFALHLQYEQLYAEEVVNIVNGLHLPRYGLGNYVLPKSESRATEAEKAILKDLSKAGKRLMGFCRTNLFKRLESSGQVFLQSLERHLVRNYVYLYALENGLPIPIGTQDAGLLDTRHSDLDSDSLVSELLFAVDDEPDEAVEAEPAPIPTDGLRAAGQRIYEQYRRQYAQRFKWLPSKYFTPQLVEHLRADAEQLMQVIRLAQAWNPAEDEKLNALYTLLTQTHPAEKVIVFTQFADTVDYLTEQLQARGITALAGVTGKSDNPTGLAQRFSPRSNKRNIQTGDELRVLIATDVLSEGQNLQDAAIVVNFDIAWAIIRLIQRAGRVDRIGQRADTIHCYTFLPADGVERIIRLRQRIRQRLQENAEVVGTDEAFFEDDGDNIQAVLDLYNERAGILDADDDNDIDLSSYAYQIWRDATTKDPYLADRVIGLPDVVHSTKAHIPYPGGEAGSIIYMRAGDGNDALIWLDETGEVVSESQFTILNAARCEPSEPALPRPDDHYERVLQGVERLLAGEQSSGGQLGRPSSPRYRLYQRLKAFADKQVGTYFERIYEERGLSRAIEQLYRYPLLETALASVSRSLKLKVSDDQLVELVLHLYADKRLCYSEETQADDQPQIICTLGLQARG